MSKHLPPTALAAPATGGSMTRVAYRNLRQRSARPLTPEGITLKAIKQLCALRQVPCYRLGAGAFYVGERFLKLGDKGLPDLLLLTSRGVVLVEVKSPRGTLTPEQRTFRDQCRSAKVTHVVARDVTDVLPWMP